MHVVSFIMHVVSLSTTNLPLSYNCYLVLFLEYLRYMRNLLFLRLQPSLLVINHRTDSLLSEPFTFVTDSLNFFAKLCPALLLKPFN